MSRGTSKQNITAFVYDKKGKLLAVGRNSYIKTHPLQYKYAVKSGNPSRVYLHAEIDALLKGSRRGDVYSMKIVRIGKKGTPLLAKPCECCQLAIRDFGVRKVEHT